MASPKLTNIIRDAFVRAVISDVPQQDYREQIRSYVLKVAVDRLPPKVRAVWDNHATRGFIRMEAEWLEGMSISLPQMSGNDGFQFTADDMTEIKRLSQSNDAQQEKIDDLESKVRAVAYSVTTVKALLEQLPEFEKYLPKGAKLDTRVPAVANLVKDLLEAGWPDGGKKQQLAAEAA